MRFVIIFVTAWFLRCVAGWLSTCAAFLHICVIPGFLSSTDANVAAMNFVYFSPMTFVIWWMMGMRLKSKSSGIVLRFGACVTLAGGGMP